MSIVHSAPARIRHGITVTVTLALAAAAVALIEGAGDSPLVAQASATLEATIFRFDPQGDDFVRTQTTLQTEEGESAANTMLAHDSPAYEALMQKRSYTGEATLFGQSYDAHYAPLTDADGGLTGALFVAVPR